jgi:adenylate kinase family enzyme
MLICGPSGSGKTYFVAQLLRHRKEAFNVPLGKIWWLYGSQEGEHGDTATQLDTLKDDIEYIQGFRENWQNLPKAHDVLVIDDLMTESANQKDLTNMFLKTARHRSIFLIFLSQNLFQPGMRTRSINTHYLVLFKNPRDSLAIKNLARQIPIPSLLEMFRDATDSKPYGYMLFDFTQECPDSVRIRTNIFEPPVIVYKHVDESSSYNKKNDNKSRKEEIN